MCFLLSIRTFAKRGCTLFFVKFDVFRAFIFPFNLLIDGVRLSRAEKVMFAWEGDFFGCSRMMLF